MNANIIAGLVLLLVIVALFVYLIIQYNRKNKERMSASEFINQYLSTIINVAQDIATTLAVNPEDYETEDEYIYALVAKTIREIKENAENIGIEICILNMIDEDTLSDIITSIITNHCDEIYSKIPSSVIVNNIEIFGTHEQVIADAYFESED